MGTDDYIVSEYNQKGVVFNFYNGCKLKSVYVIVPKSVSGISSAVVEAQKADAPRYNMAGQQVLQGRCNPERQKIFAKIIVFS